MIYLECALVIIVLLFYFADEYHHRKITKEIDKLREQVNNSKE